MRTEQSSQSRSHGLDGTLSELPGDDVQLLEQAANFSGTTGTRHFVHPVLDCSQARIPCRLAFPGSSPRHRVLDQSTHRAG